MKYTLFLLVELAVLSSAIYFQQTQKDSLIKIERTRDTLQRELRAIEDDLDFLKQSHNQLNFLISKGWFIPQNRLIGSEIINLLTNHLNTARFTIEPELIKEEVNLYYFKVSKIIINVGALLDTDIYDFVSNISKNFPGILILQKLSLDRNEPINELNALALRGHKRPSFVVGEIIYEWFSMGGRRHEK